MRTQTRARRTPSPLGVAMMIAVGLASLAPAQDPAPVHTVIPQSRMFAYTAEQQGAVKVTRVEADIDIVEAVATTTLEIHLENTTSSRQEAELIVPIADEAVVSGFAYDGPSGEITAQVLPKEEAERIYNQLVAQIRDPALAEFVGYNLIGTSVFPIEPRATQRVRLTYEHLLVVEDNRVDYVLPRTESLQYQVPWKISVDIEANQPISTVYSPSHQVYSLRQGDGTINVMTDPDAEFTPGAFQLSYLIESDQISASLLAYPGEDNDAGYFLLLAGVSAERPADAAAIKREVTLALDCSGSMSGEKIRQAKDAAIQVVSGLDDGEAFNVILYDSAIKTFSPSPVLKDPAMEVAAHNYIGAISAGGSTNLHGALQTALSQTPTEGMLPLVLFLTDGLPTSGITSEVAIRDLAVYSNPYERRVFTFGVGYNVNAPLLDGLAQLSRAQSFFVLPGDDVETTVTGVFKSLAGPVFSDPSLRILDAEGQEAIGRTQDILPVLLPDLFEGDRLVILGRYIGEAPLTFEFSGNYLGQPETFSHTFDFAKASKDHGFIPRLWASRKIAELINSIRQLGADPSITEDDPVIKELAESIVTISTEYGIITEYTAFLAREGTDLGDWTDVLGQATGELVDRGAGVRSGEGAVNQSINIDMQRAQDVLNRDSSYLNSDMERTRIVNAQQANDLTFYFKDGRWIDSRLVTVEAMVTPHRTVEFGSDEFFEVANDLAEENRQGALAFAQDILLLLDGEIILIDIPADVEEEYDPVDPEDEEQAGACARRGR